VAIERHQTLRTTVEWSHQLLSEPEQRLLRRLGVFAGGFTMGAAAEVTVLPGEALDVAAVLASLVRRSMVQLDRSPTSARYRLLETIRTYAQERLAAVNEAERLGRAHAQWVAAMLDHPVAAWLTRGSGLWRTLAAERDNWREAVGFALAHGDPSVAVALLTHFGCIDLPGSSEFCHDALALDGIESVPRWYWLHHTIAARGASEVDLDALRHIEQFAAACISDIERAYAGWWRAVLSSLDGSGDPLADIEGALATPGLAAPYAAHLEALRAFWTNVSGVNDVDAARRAVEAARRANSGTALPYAYAVLAMALRDTDPDGALDALREVVALTANDDDAPAVGRGATLALGLSAVTGIRPDLAARYLRDHLQTIRTADRTVEETYLAVCANVLSRAGHSAAGTVRSYVVSRPVDNWIYVLLPDADDTAVPAQLDDLVDIIRAALDDVCLSTS